MVAIESRLSKAKFAFAKVFETLIPIFMKSDFGYKLDDALLIERALEGAKNGEFDPLGELSIMVFRPHQSCVVMGQSVKVAQAVDQEACRLDGIPIWQRPSGGESVFISANMMIVSYSILSKRLPPSKMVFSLTLASIIKALQSLAMKGVEHRGISDLAVEDRKILGCAIYRNKNMLIFHAVINVEESSQVIAKYLLHPQKEPDYRLSRKHEDFVSSLKREGFEGTYGALNNALKEYLYQDLPLLLEI